jgi:hypothetical protein
MSYLNDIYKILKLTRDNFDYLPSIWAEENTNELQKLTPWNVQFNSCDWTIDLKPSQRKKKIFYANFEEEKEVIEKLVKNLQNLKDYDGPTESKLRDVRAKVKDAKSDQDILKIYEEHKIGNCEEMAHYFFLKIKELFEKDLLEKKLEKPEIKVINISNGNDHSMVYIKYPNGTVIIVDPLYIKIYNSDNPMIKIPYYSWAIIKDTHSLDEIFSNMVSTAQFRMFGGSIEWCVRYQ